MFSRNCLVALRPSLAPKRVNVRTIQPQKRGFLALPNREEGLPVFSIIGANLAVFGGWYYAESNWDRRLYRLMQVWRCILRAPFSLAHLNLMIDVFLVTSHSPFGVIVDIDSVLPNFLLHRCRRITSRSHETQLFSGRTLS